MKNEVCLTRDEITDRLKAKGLQPTLQRVGICQYVLCEGDHPTAEDVHLWAEKNLGKISLATVYNTLHSLVEVGLLREFRFPHLEKAVYDNNLNEHHHFFDEATGQIVDLHSDTVSLKTNLSSDFEIRDYDILLRGTLKNKTKGLRPRKGE